MRFKLIQSKYETKNNWFDKIENELNDFGENQYQRLKPLIIEKVYLKSKLTFR